MSGTREPDAHPSASIGGNRLEWLRRVIAGEVQGAAVGQLIGFTLRVADADHAVVELDADARHANPMGTVHGGIFCDVADAAMGLCFFAGLAPDETFTTLELKVNFLRPLRHGLLCAEARVVQRGRTVGLLECDVTDGAGRLLARASATQLVLRGEAAQGR